MALSGCFSNSAMHLLQVDYVQLLFMYGQHTPWL